MKGVKDLPEIRRNAEAYKAIGEREIHLFVREEKGNLDGLPWDHVEEVTTGGFIRLGANVSLHFKARDPSGLWFEWSVDIENRDANGTGGFGIAKERLASILTKLPPVQARKMRGFLGEVADKVRENADKSMDWMQRQYGQEGILRALAADSVSLNGRSVHE